MCGHDDNFPFCTNHESLYEWVTDTIHDYLKTGKTTDEGECCDDPKCPIGRSVRFSFKDVLQLLIMRVDDKKVYVQCEVIAKSKKQKINARKIREAVCWYMVQYTDIRTTIGSKRISKAEVKKMMNDVEIELNYTMKIKNPITYDPKIEDSSDEDSSDEDAPPEYVEEDAPPAYA